MKKNFKYLIMLLAFISVSITACQKDNFDEPNVTIEDPNLPVTHTIAELKALYTTMGRPLEITDEIIIKGVVIADDKSGNFYKQLIIDDGTAGIAIAIDETNLYTTYPVGRKVYVKCKGLYLGDYNNLIQLGGGIDQEDNTEVARIVSTLIDEYIVKGPAYQTVTPIDVTIDELDNSYQNRLIRITDAQFAYASTGATYANAITQQSVNHIIMDCSGGNILLRTSGFANFANSITPTGNGTLTAVYSVYGTDAQLYIRDTTDVNMPNDRCSGISGTLTTIADLKAMYAGSGTTTVPNDIKVKATVISDRTYSNENGRNAFIQDATGGIIIRFSANHNLNVGDVIEVNLNGSSLSLFSGALQVGTSIPSSQYAVISNSPVTPRVTTIPDIIANFSAWESTLVTIPSVALSGGTAGTYKNNVTLTDASNNTLILFTSNSATFINDTYPTATSTVTGYLTKFVNSSGTTLEIKLRSTADVQ